MSSLPKDPAQNLSPLQRLLAIMARLRDPVGGCPWDIEQTFASIAPHTVEEAYEVADAITRNDMNDLKQELGDLLLQVVFHAQMAAEQNLFTMDDVMTGLSDKLVSRHPHVFGDQTAATAADVNVIWEARKDAEKPSASAIDGVTLGLPALLRAEKLQKKAQKVNFVWPDAAAALAKVDEELAELKAARDDTSEAVEIGDLLFALANYARMKGYAPEDLLVAANRKFERRFRVMEQLAGREKFASLPLEDMLRAWAAAKAREKP